jgi:hypothetical protein
MECLKTAHLAALWLINLERAFWPQGKLTEVVREHVCVKFEIEIEIDVISRKPVQNMTPFDTAKGKASSHSPLPSRGAMQPPASRGQLLQRHLSSAEPPANHSQSEGAQLQTPRADSSEQQVISNLNRASPHLIKNHTRITNLGNPNDVSMPAAAEDYQYDGGLVTDLQQYNMDAMAFAGQPYLSSGFQQTLSADEMSHFVRGQMDSSMGILSAERYNDGGAAMRAGTRSQRQGAGQQQNPAIFGLSREGGQRRGVTAHSQNQHQHQREPSLERNGGDRRRKKQKLSEDEDGDDDASKKARGRPRLDTKDETAADVGFEILFFRSVAFMSRFIFSSSSNGIPGQDEEHGFPNKSRSRSLVVVPYEP